MSKSVGRPKNKHKELSIKLLGISSEKYHRDMKKDKKPLIYELISSYGDNGELERRIHIIEELAKSGITSESENYNSNFTYKEEEKYEFIDYGGIELGKEKNKTFLEIAKLFQIEIEKDEQDKSLEIAKQEQEKK